MRSGGRSCPATTALLCSSLDDANAGRHPAPGPGPCSVSRQSATDPAGAESPDLSHSSFREPELQSRGGMSCAPELSRHELGIAAYA